MAEGRVLALALVAIPLVASAEPDPAHLERLVIQDCGSCHGLTRKGGLGPDLRAESLSHWDADGLTEIILDGIPGTAMPPWRPLLTEAEAQWIAQYLLTTE
ncbi:c-type cytochrome [Palleronia caenipelagi]|uniref:Cytochrome c n=1 Tax=Palleronia caenipelagi TaxID=2489174 RepID=A0A547QA16_9RHOB|nr:cytochrome c [Palleronia caenipelagi]TRD23235.1 cytochrome c [Palleronia caenipelagi]